MNFDLSEIVACGIYILLWCLIMAALTVLCKDGIVKIVKSVIQRQRMKFITKEDVHKFYGGDEKKAKRFIAATDGFHATSDKLAEKFPETYIDIPNFKEEK